MRATMGLLMLALSAGCPDRTISEVPVDQGKVEVIDIPSMPNRNLDILFVIDDSLSMKDEQDALRADFPNMIGVLESIEGGLPDVQIGVVTPNLGTSATDGSEAASIGGCSGRGEDGVLRQLGAGGPRFLRDVDDGAGGRDRNYAGTLADAFSQLADVGTNGCGIEQHLGAIERATDGSHPENAGFLRPEAYLAVILIADEDDCSLAHSTLFDSLPRTDPTWAIKTNFRCTTQGVVCDTPSTPFDTATGPREDCHPVGNGEVSSIDRYVDHLVSLKADPRDIVVAGIVGEPDAFEIVKLDGQNQLGNSCPTGGPGNATAPIRTGAFIDRFEHRDRSTICTTDLAQGLVDIGAVIKDTLADPCFETDPLDVDPTTPGLQASCSVTTVRRVDGQPDQELDVVPPCDSGRSPCWRIEEDDVHCSYTDANPHVKLVVEGLAPDPALRIKADCVTANPDAPVL